MTDYVDPPVGRIPAARIIEITPDVTVWRIHSSAADRDANVLNPTPQPRARRGGRFDSIDGSFSYLYLGDSPAATVAETLCRNLPVDQSPRLIPRAQIRGRVLSEVRLTRTIRVADLTGAAAARINAGVWLTKCSPDGYLHTRRWAHAILDTNEGIDGLQYRPRHDENNLAWMLTGLPSATTHDAIEPAGRRIELDSADGHYLLGDILVEHNAALAP
ncbi:RES family NAD+ phosphorylase [Rhodococcus sp. NPDC058521]|uniref:RES family NAD+ phosphorylase n=1 Tax=Rhodococcus sp. NPDC058521 TaxID=3346536 RepID=UPI00365069FF